MGSSGGGARNAREMLLDYLARCENPDEIDFEALLAGHPAQAEELQALLAELSRRVSRKRSGADPTSARAEDPEQSGTDAALDVLQHLFERSGKWRYRIEEEVARGGQGAVLRVWDEDLQRPLAMKVALGSRSSKKATPLVDSRSLGRFLEEAQVTAQLDHPGIVPVHQLGVDEHNQVFFTMKLVKGRDLKEIFSLVQQGQEGWTQTRALGVLLKVCEAVGYAHAKGVIHRDLKPGNVMVGRFGEVYVMDWGLARVLGRADGRDLRIQGSELTAQVRSIRLGQASTDPEAPLITMDGDVVGTPAYMPPEQAAGDIEAMGPHSDVYAAGAMLYHLLSGHMPFVPPGRKLTNQAIWFRLQQGPPEPIHQRAPNVPIELVAICEKAMAREPSRRYADMLELAEDLRAFLEHRVVHAYETGAWAELRKWVRRNLALSSAIAAAAVLALAGLGGVYYFEARGRRIADRERGVAEERAAEARLQEAVARSERANVMRLSTFQNLEDLQQETNSLWPAAPDRIPAFERWLEDARELVAGLHPDPTTGESGHYAQLKALEARALPRTQAELQAAIEGNPRRGELEQLEQRIGVLRRARETRATRASLDPFPLDESLALAGAVELNDRAWPLVDPDRTAFGREEEGLALARWAYARATAEVEIAIAGDTLAWALFANGQDKEALEISDAALKSAPLHRTSEFREYRERLEREIAHASGKDGELELASLERRRDTLFWELSNRTFASEEDRWWHAQLVLLVAEIEAFADPRSGLLGSGLSARFGWGVQRRLSFAQEVEERTRTGPPARALWSQAISAIADPIRSPAYRGLKISPQLGLLPIGPDPASGLWEFAHVQSGEVPVRAADGSLELRGGTALVLVLIPGGSFTMGAQRQDPSAASYDPMAEDHEGPTHVAFLSPFFLSKYEMTQGQWERFTGSNPSYYKHSEANLWVLPTHPVESLSWDDARLALDRLELELPSEAQWEYAARAGTGTPWWTGSDPRSLQDAANLSDLAVERASPNLRAAVEFDDGHAYPAPVDAQKPNPWGLHGVAGNVMEWCMDAFQPDAYQGSRSPDPVVLGSQKSGVARGGCFSDPPQIARSACRVRTYRAFGTSGLGLRPARGIDP